MTVAQQFEEAASKVSSGSLGNLTQIEQLDLYGLYAVVKKGAAPSKGPSVFLDPRGYAKWTSWSSRSHLQKEEAMEMYVQLVSKFDSDAHSGRQRLGVDGGLFGAKGPTGFDLGGEQDYGEAKKDICFWATQGDIKSVKYCLEKQGVSPNFRDQDGLTPLMRAVDRNNQQLVDILVAAGADLDAVDEEGQSALHYAAYCEHADMAGLLVTYGATTDIRDNDGLNPIEAATGATKAVIEAARDGKWKPPGPTTTKAATFSPREYMPSKAWQVATGISVVLAVALIIRYRYHR
eukprot:GFKZ01001979.1.p1 GENE.GFKZ01001979.1~~GFKZ01001979.1.p1  ORF type:complete len:312 (-),score=39.15 GFKZ01001979.1:523-1395(-)